MKWFLNNLIFAAIGVFPHIIGGYSLITWQWWAIVSVLITLVCIHDVTN